MLTTIRSSQLSRYMTCSGFAAFANLPPLPTNEAAENGTAAGEYLEKLLTTGEEIAIAKNGVTITDEMKYYVRPLAEAIKARATSKIDCELDVGWRTASGFEITGHLDVSYMVGDVLHIDDLKYGYGLVEVNDNWQLISYAIGLMSIAYQQGLKLTKVVTRIMQPRAHHEDGPLREREYTLDELLSLRGQIAQQMDLITKGQVSLVTSQKCKYCPALIYGKCTAIGRAFYNSVDVVLNGFKPDEMSDDDLAQELDLFYRIEDIFKIKIDSLRELAVDRIKQGKIVKGYIMDQKLGDRSWKKDVDPEMIKLLTGIDITERVTLTPAKAEKLGVDKDLVAGMIERKFLGNTIKRGDASKLGDKIFGKKT